MSSNPGTTVLSPVKQALLALEEMTARVDALQRAQQEPIAIVGLACRFPGAPDAGAFWQLLRDGRDAVGEIPRARWDSDALYDPDPDAPGRISTRWGGFLDEIDTFDSEFFGISPREAASMDPQQRLLLEVAWEALEDAGQGPERLAASRTGVFVGITGDEYAQQFLKAGDPSKYDVYFASGIARSVAGGRISYVLGMQGPNMAIDTACSSSLVAVHTACLHLRSGDCRTALAGGANVILSPEITMAFSKSHMMASDGRCKTFDSRADGFVRAEGCGVVVLKRLSDAVADGDRVLAVIRGSAVNQDGRSSGLTAPSGPAQEAVIREALAKAQVDGSAIDYVEAHGTGTSLGDPIEAHALRDALGANRSSATPLVLGSVKTNVGHLEAAAGIAGLIKVVLSLGHEWIPAHLHYLAINPHIDWRGVPVDIPVSGRGWPRGDRRRLAGVSAFGFSGTNAHVIVEEAPTGVVGSGEAATLRTEVLALSARTEPALRALAARYAGHLAEHAELRLVDVCHTANTGRAPLPERLAIVASTTAELLEKLTAGAAGADAPGMVRGRAGERGRAKVAFLFTGQGAQYAGMGRGLYDAQPVFKEAIDECERLLGGALDEPLTSVLWGPASGRLDDTRYTQPALFAVEWALAQLWRSWGVEPSVVLGHSVGEYVAACVAGVYSLADGLRLIAARGRLMGGLPSGEGTMAAVLAPAEAVRAAVTAHGGLVDVASVNGVENTVIAGARADVEDVAQQFERGGSRVERLRVSHAFHSPLMNPIEEAFASEARRIPMGAPKRLLVSSVTGAVVSGDELNHPDYWKRQVRQAVQFHTAVQTAASQNCAVWVEIGPGSTLLGLTSPVVPGACLVPSLRRGRDEPALIAESLASVWVRGVSVGWEHVGQDAGRRRISLPTYPFERQRYWLDTSAVPGAPRIGGPAAGSSHPLLGTPIQTPRGDVICQAEVSAATVSLLADHVVHDLSVLPATAYLEMIAGAAAATLGGGELSIEGVAIDHALALHGSEQRAVQTLAVPAGDRSTSVEIHSRAVSGEWTRHASAVVRLADAAAPPSADPIDDVRARCRHAVDVNVFYANLRARGLAFGESFRGLQEIHRVDGEALGRVVAPASAKSEAAVYRFHPAVLDACIQTLAAAVPGFDPADAHADVYMPTGIDRLIWRDLPAAGPLVSHAWFDSAEPGAERWLGSVSVSGEQGEVIRIDGLHLRRVPRERLQQLAGSQDVFYQVAWEETPASEPPPATLSYDAGAMERRLRELCAEHGTDEYDRLNPALERACARFVVNALDGLGWNPCRGEQISAGELADRLGVQPRFVHLLNRLLAILAEEGVLTARGARWEVTGSLMASASPGADLLDAEAAGRHDAAMTLRCGGKLTAVLRGEVDPLQVLFPKGDLSEAAALYAETPLSKAFNSLVGDTVASLVSRIPESQPIRILEIGAGTGGTTTHVLPRVPAARTEYTYTDLGQSFVARAREVFGDSGCRMRFQTLDIEQDPTTQGFDAGSFDIVLASNVLHATANLEATLRHARMLLRPGGAAVIFESIRPQRWFDVTFGLTDGWWRFAGRDPRRDYTLLDLDGWRLALKETGFRDSAPVLRQDLDRPLYAVIVGIADGAAAAAPGRPWLVFADQSGMADHIAGQAGEEGRPCVLVRPGERYTCARGRITVRPEHPADYAQALKDAETFAGASVESIVHLWAAGPHGRSKEEGLAGSQRLGCRSVLNLAQAVAARAGAAPACWIVTTDAQPVAMSALLDVSGSTIWGLMRGIVAERPELRMACIDLEEAAGAEAAANVLHEMQRRPSESQVAYRGGRRYVARLARRHGAGRSQAAGQAPVEITIASPGSLESVELRPQVRREPGAGEVEVQVRAAGLNFRDVLNALGMRRDHDPLGGESSGIVTRLGPGVSTVKSGDEVIAIAPGTFGSFVVAAETLVVPKPASMTFVDAATMPFAFLTADYALRDPGRLRAGERVLIHAAAGGVGLAAVQIALAAGAEVFATAGSDEKRAFLSALGVPHVMDSRSLSFESAVRERTGGAGLDIVLNSLTGEAIPAGLRLLARGGRFLEIGKAEIWDQARAAAVNAEARYVAIDLTDTIVHDGAAIRQRLLSLLGEVERGSLRPLPRSVFPFDRVADAFRHMARARHIGKVVLTPAVGEGPSVEGPQFRQDSWYLITGGLRGLGVEVARWMADRGARRLALMSRREPPDDVRPVLAALRERGVEVRIIIGDVSRRADVETALAQLSGAPVRGVIHAAGVLDDGVLDEQTWSRVETVLAPKMQGAWNLHVLTRGLPLDFFVMFSSVASVFGAAGQANHGAANAFLDTLAHRRRAEGLPALSLNWGPWADVGAAVGAVVRRRLATLGLRPFTVGEGLEALAATMARDEPQVAAIAVDWPAYLRHLGDAVPPFFTAFREQAVRTRPARAGRVAAVPDRESLRSQLEALPQAARRRAVDAHVEASARRILGLRQGQAIDPSWPLNEMGLDSLMAIELRNAIGTAAGLSLPATLLFDYPTIATLGEYLMTAMFGQATRDRPIPKEPAAAPAAFTLDAIEQLSDDEVDRLLGSRKE
jgi:acyl transferase domain-containing protein